MNELNKTLPKRGKSSGQCTNNAKKHKVLWHLLMEQNILFMRIKN